ncbi:MAG: YggS family pyridoxal phosphate-dependent enzyme [Bacteroides sp.]|nr:YggS family pyridoxal phosphate-dependent enzyme [Bacteroides sp.]MDE6077916.1 YggS family pyridoxal phosphate-dependent enzyme [Muribaculaceae bacterium]MDE6422623.1 YggS family pyridoxal phosphate-dependent enzyme [Muribaculaceae bacterium]
MTCIADNLRRVKEMLPAGVELVAVSKFHPVEALKEAYDAGQRCFGESRVQELTLKERDLPSDIRWHFIGHLQTNKVKQLIGKTSLIESVDSERLLRLIDSESAKAGVITRVLMQVHVAREETKFGFYPEELLEFFTNRGFETLTNTHICGVMGMASNTDDMDRVKADFHQIAEIYRQIRDDESLGLRGFDTLSMGMSGDWPIAVEEGSNLVRIGTAIFGEREY